MKIYPVPHRLFIVVMLHVRPGIEKSVTLKGGYHEYTTLAWRIN
jgi:hypothetical protein